MIATLSNGNVALLVNMAKHGRLPWDAVLSAELFHHYKPDPEAYLGAAAMLGFEPSEVMMVAAHKDDLRAAQACGLATAFVRRPREKGPKVKVDVKPEADFDFNARDFVDLARRMALQRARVSQATTKATRHRVLIVDDEESMRLFLARILVNGLKVEVTLAGTCEQALRLAGNYAYDAILLDLLMPGIGGFEVLREIRRASPNVATPVIIVSVLSDQATKDRCMRAGANAYVVKPVERNALVATVKAQIAGRGKPKTRGK